MWVSKHKPPKVKASQADYRGSITAVVMITHDKIGQRALPQSYIGNEHVLGKEALEGTSVGHTDAVHFRRERSSWNSINLVGKIVALLAKALTAFPTIQPILVFDAASIHIHHNALEASIRHKVWMMCVPARTTWLLQPLDTQALARTDVDRQCDFRVLD